MHLLAVPEDCLQLVRLDSQPVGSLLERVLSEGEIQVADLILTGRLNPPLFRRTFLRRNIFFAALIFVLGATMALLPRIAEAATAPEIKRSVRTAWCAARFLRMAK
jgi:hypothetical protein